MRKNHKQNMRIRREGHMTELEIMNQEDFESQLDSKTKWIEDNLKKFLPHNITYQKTIYDAMEYSLMAGGKRLRPMIMKETYSMFGGCDDREILPFMAAMEMVHTYSLVHDDLPAMDNDEYRRGRKTTHIVYGEDMGILAGDALLNYAYEIMAASLTEGENTMAKVKALQIISKKAGIYGMVGGQVADVEMTGKPLTEELLEFIYRLKTGALIEASFMVGAALAGADDELVSDMERAGYNVGMAFQIQDDILDITSTTKELGKPVHSDEKNEKSTYASIHGMEDAVKAVETYSKEALDILGSMKKQNSYLNTLVEKLIRRKK